MSVLSADFGYRLSYPYFAAPDDFTGVTNTFLLLDQSTRRVSVNISIADDSIVEAIEIFQASTMPSLLLVPAWQTSALTTMTVS